MDWKDKLLDEYRAKRQAEDDEARRRQNHDDFISAEGWSAWEELKQKAQQGCSYLSSRAGANLVYMQDEGEGFIITGSSQPLDVALEPKTRKINWAVRGSQQHGTLKPDRQGDALVYRDNGNVIGPPEEAVLFLLRKVF